MASEGSGISDFLNRINPSLERKRKGAWQALQSDSLDNISQAASSMREVFNQLLHELADDESVMKAPWYESPSKGDPRVTRRMRVRFALSGNLEMAENDVKLVESFADLVDMLYSKLSNGTHSRGIGVEQQVEAYLRTCEAAILNVFVHRKLVNGWSIELRCDRLPFSDLRVRKAMQMGIDRKNMARILDGGWSLGRPAGLVSPKYIGFFTPYDRWPSDLQAEYSYAPDTSRRLLSEAGYPNGFRTKVTAPVRDVELLSLVKSYYQAIGVDLVIDVKEVAVWIMLAMTGKVEQMIGLTAATAIDKEPQDALGRRVSSHRQNYTGNNDPEYDGLIRRISEASTSRELKRLCTEADMYALKQHWAIQLYI